MGGSKVEVGEDTHEGRSYSVESELELGLGLSLGGAVGKNSRPIGGAWGECGKLLTAKDFPSVGTKRAADSVSHAGASPPRSSQVVGWPPVGTHRMNSLFSNQVTNAHRAEEESKHALGQKASPKEDLEKINAKERSRLVKVKMDGVPIGRKVDLNAHSSYELLAQTLEDMFFHPSPSIAPVGSRREKEKARTPKLLDGLSEFVITYEDKEGDWLLLGDVPWRMFLSSVRRLRILRTSEANGLGPRHQERDDRQRNKPV